MKKRLFSLDHGIMNVVTKSKKSFFSGPWLSERSKNMKKFFSGPWLSERSKKVKKTSLDHGLVNVAKK